MIHIPQAVARIPILRGVLRLLITAWVHLFHGRYLIERRMGLLLLLDCENVIDWQLVIAGTWERPELDVLFRLADEQRQMGARDAVFLDIGAHWGLYALLAIHRGRFSRIAAFEPDPTNYAQLQANLFLNGAQTSIEALQLAASDRERTFGLSLRTARNRGGARVVEPAAGQVTCRGVRVDSLFDFADKLLVAKIDVEGHELEAIDGLSGLLGRNHCVLQIEVWGEPDTDDYKRRFEELSVKLAGYGIKFVRSIASDFFFVSNRSGGQP